MGETKRHHKNTIQPYPQPWECTETNSQDTHRNPSCYLRCIQGTGVQVALQCHCLPHMLPGSRVGATLVELVQLHI